MSWVTASFAILGVALVAGFAWYERAHPTARVIALVPTLAALPALAGIGVPAFACTPDLFPEMMEAAIERRDVGEWAASQDIPTSHEP